MIHPDLFGVRTIVFDMDGTLVRSGKMAVESLRGALADFFGKRNLDPPSFTEDDLKSWLGAPVNDFYRSMLPDHLKDEWPEFHKLAAVHERSYLQNHRIMFPGTTTVLDELRRRGYKLGLVSNCNREYLDDVINTQNLRDRLDMAACIGDREGATKADMLKEVITTLGSPAVMVGDRYYDVDAAKKCGIPSVGALYGYGNRKELEGTSTWVGDIRDLLDLFDPLRELGEKIAGVLNGIRLNERPIFVSLTAPHTVVTAPLLFHLLNTLSEMYIPAVHLPLDMHRLCPVGDLAEDPSGNLDSFYPWRQLSEAIQAVDTTNRFEVTLPSLASESGKRSYRARGGAVVLVTGPFQRAQAGWLDRFHAAYEISTSWRTVKRDLQQITKKNLMDVSHLVLPLLPLAHVFSEDIPHWKSILPPLQKQAQKLERSARLELSIDGDNIQTGAAVKLS